MAMTALFAFLVGAVLGMRFRVQILIPTGILGIAAVLTTALLRGSLSSALLVTITFAVALQLGYLGGLFTRFCMVIGRAARHRSLHSNAAQT